MRYLGVARLAEDSASLTQRSGRASRGGSNGRTAAFEEMHFVYILKSDVAAKSYVGLTTDVSRRLEQHNAGLHAYTKRYAPWKVIRQEEYATVRDARVREKYLKSAAGRRFLRAVFGN